MTTNKLTHAQFFTPPALGLKMAKLLQNQSTLLEPAAGDGALVRAVRAAENDSKVVAVELDVEKATNIIYADEIVQSDFFEFPIDRKFASIIANPPYLPNRKIPDTTKSLPTFKKMETALGKYANLYAFFILKCFYHLEECGEMVFVVPSEVYTATGNHKLNTLLHNHGTFTNVIKFVKTPFSEVSPDVVVFKYVKGDFSYETKVEVV